MQHCAQVLGTHVAQKGSLVNDEYLRFDCIAFCQNNREEELVKVEALVNEKIRENIPGSDQRDAEEEAIDSGASGLV